jgi:hypothetical protein
VKRPALFLFALFAACSREQRPFESNENSFRWSGTIPAGGMVHIRNNHGNITVEPAPAGDVVVTAKKRWTTGDPSAVRFAVDPAGGAICALWDTKSRCEPKSYKPNLEAARANDTAVDFVVQLPKGIGVDVRTVEGDIITRQLASPVIAMTSRGSIDATTDVGPVTAETVSGNIITRLGSLGASGDVRLSAMGGTVQLVMPPDADATIDASSSKGAFRTDATVAALDSAGGNRFWTVKLGQGTRRVVIATVNGDIEVKTKTASSQ